MKYLLLGGIALLVVGGPAISDNAITLALETPGLEQSAQADQPEQQRPRVTTVTTQASDAKPAGRVGLVSVDKARIYARRSTKSRVYSTCTRESPLAIIGTSGSWFGVLMIDGSTGWVQQSKVKLLDYGFVPPPPRRGTLTSRSGSMARGVRSGTAVVQAALQYLGVPYVYGGSSASNGIDCSAFVKSVYSQFGVSLPRVSRDQANYGSPVAYDDLQPGDRLYFACKHSYVDHCGIYMGDGYFIHASASRGGVAVDVLSAKFYAQSLVAVMR